MLGLTLVRAPYLCAEPVSDLLVDGHALLAVVGVVETVAVAHPVEIAEVGVVEIVAGVHPVGVHLVVVHLAGTVVGAPPVGTVAEEHPVGIVAEVHPVEIVVVGHPVEIVAVGHPAEIVVAVVGVGVVEGVLEVVPLADTD